MEEKHLWARPRKGLGFGLGSWFQGELTACRTELVVGVCPWSGQTGWEQQRGEGRHCLLLTAQDFALTNHTADLGTQISPEHAG